MSVLVVLSTPNSPKAPDSTPRRIVSILPSVSIEVIHFAHGGETATPYVWVKGVSASEFERAIRADPRIADLTRLDAEEDGTLFKVRWHVDSPLIHCVAAADGMVMQAEGIDEEWTLKIWFEDADNASQFQRCCSAQGIPLEIHRLTSFAGVLAGQQEVVSERQREALVLAHERGYFDEPRQSTQDEIATQLDISTAAFGRRLRRGFRNLVEQTVIE